MGEDLYYSRCCISGSLRPEWHHQLIFAGRQVNEKWAIIPLSNRIHSLARLKHVKEVLDWIMVNRATDEELLPYCKAINYIKLRETLNEKYGPYSTDRILFSGPRESFFKQIIFWNPLDN